MRTIKFRGKTRGSGKWYYGSLVYSDEINAAIYFQIGRGLIKRLDWVYVNPETIGQFTGLYDCDGKEIYEGDIYRYDNPDSINEVSYCAGGGFAGFDLTPAKHSENRLLDVEVIGNIYDNPELLKGGAE